MKPIFHPHLVNKERGDPALYIDFLFDRRAILFDIGDISNLPPKNILRLTDIFISHTHIDHFYGFDYLLRLLLGRDKYIRIYGPRGIIENVSGKLRGYTWNLVENYQSNLLFEVTEVHEQCIIKNIFSCKDAFRPTQANQEFPREEFLLDNLSFKVSCVCLDHGIPCLGFCLKEKKHFNINKVKLQEIGLSVGPWLKDLKEAIRAGKPDDTIFTISLPAGQNKAEEERKETLKDLRSLVNISAGEQIVYIVDCVYNDDNRHKILSLSEGADYFFCESAFLEKDQDRAAQRFHLTAHQAGLLARDSKAKKIIPFHFSPRYHGFYHLIVEEAIMAFIGSHLSSSSNHCP